MIETLRSLTYISTPAQPFDTDALHILRHEAARSNALEGITGMLLFNGQRFCQTVEGGVESIELLLPKLRADPRHHKLVVTADLPVEARSFGTWRMRLVDLRWGDGIDRFVHDHLAVVDPHRWFWAA